MGGVVEGEDGWGGVSRRRKEFCENGRLCKISLILNDAT